MTISKKPILEKSVAMHHVRRALTETALDTEEEPAGAVDRLSCRAKPEDTRHLFVSLSTSHNYSYKLSPAWGE